MVVVVIVGASVVVREPKSSKVVHAISSRFQEYEEYQLCMANMYSNGTRERRGDVACECAKELVYKIMTCVFVSEINRWLDNQSKQERVKSRAINRRNILPGKSFHLKSLIECL